MWSLESQLGTPLAHLEELVLSSVEGSDGTGSGHIDKSTWIKLLQRQEAAHQLELQKWHDLLGTAAGLLKQVNCKQTAVPSVFVYIFVSRLNNPWPTCNRRYTRWRCRNSSQCWSYRKNLREMILTPLRQNTLPTNMKLIQIQIMEVVLTIAKSRIQVQNCQKNQQPNPAARPKQRMNSRNSDTNKEWILEIRIPFWDIYFFTAKLFDFQILLVFHTKNLATKSQKVSIEKLIIYLFKVEVTTSNCCDFFLA